MQKEDKIALSLSDVVKLNTVGCYFFVVPRFYHD